MLIVVAYDVVDDRRRTQLHKTLRRFGERVQFSVFECLISPQQLARLRGEVADLTEPLEDSVRYYEVCEGCHRKVVTLGRAFTTSVKPYYVV